MPTGTTAIGREEVGVAPSPRAHPLRRLLQYARPYRRQIVLATLCSVTNKILDLAPPFLIGFAVSVVVNGEASSFAGWADALGLDIDTRLGLIWLLGGLTLLIWTLESLFEYFFALLWRNLAQTLQHDVRLDAFANVNGLELQYFEDRSTGRLMSVLSDDVNQLERFLDVGANDIIQILTTVVSVSIFFLVISLELGLLAMLPMPFVIWGSIAFQKKVAPRYTAVREQVGELNAGLANSLGGIATIKSFTAESYEQQRMSELSDTYRAVNRRAIRFSSAFSPLIRLVIVVGFTTTLIYGGWMALEGRLDAGLYSTLLFLTQRLLWPLTRLGQTLDLYQRAMASTHRILDLIHIESAITSGPESLAPREQRCRVDFEGVTFSYVDGFPVLRQVDLHCPAGATTAIVGATGSGKTTVIKLLLRYYDLPDDPHAGRITVDGHDLRELTLPSLRRSIALVSQDTFLFHGSVRHNIAYGRAGDPEFDPDAVDVEAIEAAARAAEAHEFIRELPRGYETIVGERGQKLSGGQRQRIAMARAILKDAPILVLDEATSAVDNETEAAIQRSLRRVSADRTTIVIAHRLSTVRHAARIYVLDRGEVAEQGTHDDLLAADGLYAALWRVQTGETLLVRE